MKHLTSKVLITLFISGFATAANAEIAAKSYVDSKVSTKADASALTNMETTTNKTDDVASNVADSTKYASTKGVATYIVSQISGLNLGDMAEKDNVATADILDGNVTKVKLASDVQTSLGKADTALQSGDISDMETQTHATATYQAKIGGGTAGTVITNTGTAGNVGSLTLGELAAASPGSCTDTTKKCVLTFDGTSYVWEVIER
ncbi:MAG: hypothetical protein LBD50_03555 [Rickettsiales bacterium]|jgi:hypothetical protein|nr:hypothetical protein [Rickettsiales bacterium]